MSIKLRRRRVAGLSALAALVLSLSTFAEAQHYQQTDLVSDLPGAPTTDANLVNPWGLSRSSTSPWWAANNGTGTATLYNGSGTAQALIVTIPGAPGSGEPGVPTGTVFNGTSDFEVAPGAPARFLFATEDGTISGWNPGVDPTHAVVKASDPDAAYKGMAIASPGGVNLLYVTNFAEGRIDVFDASFHRVRTHANAFRDRRLPRGFAPFNVENVGGSLYVTFAKVDPATLDDVQGAGLGYVDVFSPRGRLLRRLEHGPWLNAPWGVALAPGDFGFFSHCLLVGQFGSGEIAAYSVSSGRFLGKVLDASDAVLTIDGLWALSFGNGANAGPLNTLFFTAGIEDESHGLFGSLSAVPAEQLFGNGL